MRIEVNVSDWTECHCPLLRTDVGSCYAIRGSEINACPVFDDDIGDLGDYKIPDICPLRNESVEVVAAG